MPSTYFTSEFTNDYDNHQYAFGCYHFESSGLVIIMRFSWGCGW